MVAESGKLDDIVLRHLTHDYLMYSVPFFLLSLNKECLRP